MRRQLLLWIFIFILCDLTYSQSNETGREAFEEGDYFFSRGEYSEAAYYFKKLTSNNPENSHFNFRLGECYMNMPGSETLAIPCFEVATKNTTEKKKYRIKDYNEKSAPLHAWFYLGNVYRIAGRLDDALKAYDTFINSPFYYGNYNITVVENEIKSCERAKIIMDSPIDAEITVVDTSINTDAAALNPVISSDGKHLVFVRRLKFYDAIMEVSKTAGGWTKPVNLNPLIGSDGDFYPVALSFDGSRLFLTRTKNDNSDLYISFRKDNSWTKAESLGPTINTLANETSACISADGNTLWFTSSRSGGQGGLDIYFAEKKENGWGKAKNAGKIINTRFDEESPCLAGDGKVLFFSSVGHYSMGGYDIFYTVRNGKAWKSPVNIGYPVNNTSDNTGFSVENNAKTGYISGINQSDPGSAQKIFSIVLKGNYPLP